MRFLTQNPPPKRVKPTPSTEPSGTPTPSSEPSETPTQSPTLTPTESITTLLLQRGQDSVAVCVSQASNLSTLEIWFGTQSSYLLGEVFPESANTLSDGCWCLQQEPARLEPPALCEDANTERVERVSDWRNADVELRYNDASLGQCEAQADSIEIYECMFEIGE